MGPSQKLDVDTSMYTIDTCNLVPTVSLGTPGGFVYRFAPETKTVLIFFHYLYYYLITFVSSQFLNGSRNLILIMVPLIFSGHFLFYPLYCQDSSIIGNNRSRRTRQDFRFHASPGLFCSFLDIYKYIHSSICILGISCYRDTSNPTVR